MTALWETFSFVSPRPSMFPEPTQKFNCLTPAKMTSEFLFFPSNPSLNHINIEKCLLLFATNTNIFTLLFKGLKTDAKVSNLPFAV